MVSTPSIPVYMTITYFEKNSKQNIRYVVYHKNYTMQDGLAHDDGDAADAALDGVLHRGKLLLVRGGRGKEGAGLLVVVGGGAHGETAGGAGS
jgi:hypothetical protein